MDYLIIGKQLKHYVVPQAVDLTGWEKDTLVEIAKAKIQELKIRLEEISDNHDLWLRDYKTFKIQTSDLRRQIDKYQFQEEKYYLEFWLKYWRSFISKPKIEPGRLTTDDIQRAKQFPIEQLYTGNLKHGYGRLVGLCPFHKEKTPSFTIYQDSNTYFCFGCNSFGDPITFLMQTKQLKFPQAVKELI